jgi:hypothetical protein
MFVMRGTLIEVGLAGMRRGWPKEPRLKFPTEMSGYYNIYIYLWYDLQLECLRDTERMQCAYSNTIIYILTISHLALLNN